MENFSNFLFMRSEVSLLAVIVFLLLYDLIAGKKGMKYFQPVAIALLTIHTILHILPHEAGTAFGGMYTYLPMTGVVKTILNIATLIIFLQAEVFNTDRMSNKRGEYYFLTLITLLGFYFMISSGHFLLFYIGLEMASIPLATLAAMDKQSKKSAESGAKYVLLAAFSSAVMLFGISYLYGTTGTLYFADMPSLISANAIQIMAFVFFIAGMFFKISLVPFHMWTPDVYEGAPTNVTSYLSVVSKGAAAFALAMLLYKVFGNLVEQWQGILYGLIIISITLANLFAIRQKNIKRFLAFSSISQAGYIVLGIIGGTTYGMTTLVYYIFVYLFSNLAAFGVISVIENRTGKVNIPDYKGLYSTNPMLSFVMMLSMFSLGGIPPFAGFFSKFFIFAAAMEQGFYVLVLIAVINTIISLYYYLLVVKAMFIDKNETPIPVLRTDIYNKTSLIFCTLGILLVGIFSFFMERIDIFSFSMQ
ncbi:NADH-quinone oxidoreductase subunit N [Proteiniphilum sp.]|uniref:NADH-quinone oxidoreductase subunit N n=1 Tax=Proteiniphilum sp. TaxID=1926877 RepID=UPI002B209ABC|nr:NADH-quinone oxidoreductase subunit N [Proteiniphilum sp.]MEA4918510.1 NADH-quinone oxidoreductase subunit N [Proteiniphilum sp.]